MDVSTSPLLQQKLLKEKRFVRSRSRSQDDSSLSPRNNLSSHPKNNFCPKYITLHQESSLEKMKNKLLQHFSEQNDSNLPLKVKIIRLQQLLNSALKKIKQSQTENQRLKTQLSRIRLKGSGFEVENNKQNCEKRANIVDVKDETAATMREVNNKTINFGYEDILLKENKQLRNENKRLKNNYKLLKEEVTVMKKKVEENTQEREDNLRETIQSLQHKLKQQLENNRGLEVRIKVLLAREVSQSHNIPKEEYIELKNKFHKLLKQNKSLKKQLQIRRPLRYNSMNLEIERGNRELSLSLSPEER